MVVALLSLLGGPVSPRVGGVTPGLAVADGRRLLVAGRVALGTRPLVEVVGFGLLVPIPLLTRVVARKSRQGTPPLRPVVEKSGRGRQPGRTEAKIARPTADAGKGNGTKDDAVGLGATPSPPTAMAPHVAPFLGGAALVVPRRPDPTACVGEIPTPEVCDYLLLCSFN